MNEQRVLYNLEQALSDKDNPGEFIKNLEQATVYLNHNINISGNSTPIGQHGDIPINMFDLNGMYADIVYSALSQAKNKEVSEKTIQELTEYKNKLSKVVETLDIQENLWDENLRENKRVLNSASEIVSNVFGEQPSEVN